MKRVRENLNANLDQLIAGNPFYESMGVCGNLTSDEVDGYRLVEDLQKSWPLTTLVASLPVDDYAREDSQGLTFWQGSRKERRISLCKHIKALVDKMADEELEVYAYEL